nr:immunoglobulin light chain junction region [Macaca mulatta]
CQQYYLSPFTF